MAEEFSFDTDSIIDEYFDSLIKSDPELEAEYSKCVTEDEKLDFKERILTEAIDKNTLPSDVEKSLIDRSIEVAPDKFRFYSVEYNEFKNDEVLLFELLPTREAFEVKKTIFTMIGYMYKLMNQEYKKDDPRYQTINEFLGMLFKYDPEKHYKALDKHVESNFKVENDKVIGEHDMLHYNEELATILTEPPSVEQIRNIFKYKNSFANELRELTAQFYCENPGTEAIILPHGTFKTMEEADTFCKKYADKFVSDPIRTHFRRPTILGDFYRHRQNTLIYAADDEDQVLNSIFESHKRDQETVKKIMEHRSQKKMQKLTPEEIALLRKYEGTRKELMRMPNKSEEQKETLMKTEDKIENIKKKMIPEGTQPIIVKDLENKKETVILTELQ